MSKKASLLWVDLEMTGLVPGEDKILEVAAILTGWDLETIVQYEGVVKVSDEIIKTRMVGEFWEKNKKARKGLVEQNKNGKRVEEVESELIKIIEQNCGKTVYLAGNSIHQDRKFIEQEMPNLNKKLHYRMLDVSAWKVYFENALNKKFMKPEAHRALSDIRGSMDELKYYLEFIKK